VDVSRIVIDDFEMWIRRLASVERCETLFEFVVTSFAEVDVKRPVGFSVTSCGHVRSPQL
jgi:hypothetical protein